MMIAYGNQSSFKTRTNKESIREGQDERKKRRWTEIGKIGENKGRENITYERHGKNCGFIGRYTLGNFRTMNNNIDENAVLSRSMTI